MSYIFAGVAGPAGLCAQEATQSTTKINARLQNKPARRSVECGVFSSGGPSAANVSSSVSTARNGNGSPSRSRPSESQSTAWGLWGAVSRGTAYLNKHLPRALSISQLALPQLGFGVQTATRTAEAVTDQPGLATADQRTNLETKSVEAKPLLSDFLALTDEVEVSYASVLSDLSDLAYDISNLDADSLWDRHQLQLISTSTSAKCGPITREAWYAQVKEAHKNAKSPSKAAQEPNHVTQHPPQPSLDRRHSHESHRPPLISDAAAAVACALVSGELAHTTPPEPDATGHVTPSVTLISVDSFEEPSPRTSLSSTPQDHIVQIPIVTFVRSPPSSPRCSSPAVPELVFEPQVEFAVPPVKVATAQPAAEMTSSQAAALTTDTDPPAAWFACDDPVTKIRYFAIQGSTSLEHWQINLQFEPVIFEDPALGVRVHRGVYMAALKLYDDLVPLVRQHLATSSLASVTFTGHSLGGSLATVLMLLMVIRGDLPADCVSPTYTFGAPAVFCGGASALSAPTRCAECGLNCSEAQHASQHLPATCKRPRGLFAQVGLGEEHIVNVIMHRDIVPRAFACDYMAMADLLVSWMPSFKSLHGLQGPANTHKTLYSFLGRIAVLQPDTSCPFVQPSDVQHPQLPSAAGLYRLVAPAPKIRVHALDRTFDLPVPVPAMSDNDANSSLSALYGAGGLFDDAALIASMAAPGRPRPYTPAPLRFATVEDSDDESDAATANVATIAPSARAKAAAASRRVRRRSASAEPADAAAAAAAPVARPTTLKDAVAQFMNCPHPLTTLTEYGAYGPNGSISRYHNPRNYTLGLLALYGKAPHQQQASSLSSGASSAAAHFASTPPCPDAGCLSDDFADWPISPEARRLIKQETEGTVTTGSGLVEGRAATPSPYVTAARQWSAFARPAHETHAAVRAMAARLPTIPSLTHLTLLLGYKTSQSA